MSEHIIKIKKNSARVEVGPIQFWEHTGKCPAAAVRGLMFFMEDELSKLEMVDKSDLTEDAQERMAMLHKFCKGRK